MKASLFSEDGYRRMLRNTMAALALCLLAFGSSAYAQSGTVSLPSRTMTLRQALEVVDDQTDYRIAVDWDNDLDSAKTITLPTSQPEITQLLNKVLSGTGHSWAVVGQQIVITHPSTPALDTDRDVYSTIARSVIEGEKIDPTRLTFVPDPYSRTQKPFEDMVNIRLIRMATHKDGRDSTGMVVLHFRVGSSTLEKEFMDNAQALEILGRTFVDREALASLDYIAITASASPEGSTASNEKLAAARALALKSYIMWQFPFMDRDIIYTFSLGEEWSGLRELVEQDTATPQRAEVLALLDSDRSNEEKETKLRAIGGGEAYRYIARTMFPRLRGGVAVSMHYKAEPQPKIIVQEKTIVDTVYVDRPAEALPPVLSALTLTPTSTQLDTSWEKHPLFAVKTNLLYDAASALNVEVEVPIGKRWSVAGEWVFPWWLYEKKQYALEVGNANLDLKYWLGDRTSRKQLTGWFVGLSGGAGYYDLEWGDKGNRGEFFHAGLAGGFAHTIGRSGNWRMEYSLGLGYMQDTYKDYVPEYNVNDGWQLIFQKAGVYRWVGPTRAKVSLVWMFNHGVRREGGAK